ncbi:MAG: DUF4349 domain-containing protein [Clostridiales bacterium]|nr:DUF4349 domain-containing protein [Clostridiales bacterium]
MEDARMMRDDLRMMPEIMPDGDFHSDAIAALERSKREKIEKHEKRTAMPPFVKILSGLSGAVAAMAVFAIGLSALSGGLLMKNIQPAQTAGAANAEEYEMPNVFAGSEDLYVDISGAGFNGMLYSNAVSFDAEDVYETYFEAPAPEAARAIPITGGVTENDGQTALPDAANKSLYDNVTDFIIEEQNAMSENSYLALVTEDAAELVGRINSISTVNPGINVNSSNVWDNGAYITADMSLTVEGGQYAFLLATVSGIAQVTDRSESAYSLAVDLTDAANSLAAKENEYSRLLSYSDKAGDITSLISLYDRVGSVINDIDYWRGRLNSLNSAAANKHVQLSVTEKREETLPSLGERITGGFAGSIKTVASVSETVLIASAGLLAPALIIAALIGIALIPFAVWRRRRRHE